MAIDKRQRLIEFLVDKLPLCELEHVPIWAHSSFDLSRPDLFSREICRNNYLAVVNSIFRCTAISSLHITDSMENRAAGSSYFEYEVDFAGGCRELFTFHHSNIDGNSQ